MVKKSKSFIVTLFLTSILFLQAIPMVDTATAEIAVPDWIRNIAGWWSQGLVTTEEYVSSLQWLIENDIINLQTASALMSGFVVSDKFEVVASPDPIPEGMSGGFPYHRIEMTPHENSICFLTQVSMNQIEVGPENDSCNILKGTIPPNWLLQAGTSYETGDTICEARCMSWDVSEDDSSDTTEPDGIFATYQKYGGEATSINPGETITATAHCDPGDIATGGGAGVSTTEVIIASSLPYPLNLEYESPTGWQAIFENTASGIRSGNVFVVCADITP